MPDFLKDMPLVRALDNFIDLDPSYFNMPGHRRENGIPDELLNRFGEGIFRYDLTEAFTLDDLHNAQGPIKQAQELAKSLYGSHETRFLINGSTCGNEALVMACSNENNEIILSRNIHRSVVSGLVLSGAMPVWLMPEIDEDYGFAKCVDPFDLEKTIKHHPEARAVFMTSPTYYGTVSDIGAAADICHRRGIPLIVDEAHGAHLYFEDHFPKGALSLGADAVVMSAHKTLPCMTQTSMLHLKNNLVDVKKVDFALKMFMSSSPSYVLMASLDALVAFMSSSGNDIMLKAYDISMELRREIEKIDGMNLYGGSDPEKLLENGIDPSRIVFSGAALGLSGYALSELLFNEYRVSVEMSDFISCVLIVTGANSKDDIRAILNALKDISKRFKRSADGLDMNFSECMDFMSSIPEAVMTPREAYCRESRTVRTEDSLGKISAESISMYPPGIPFINPGEKIDESVLETIGFIRKNKLNIRSDHDRSLETLRVVNDA